MEKRIIKNEFLQLKKTYVKGGFKPLLERFFNYFLMQFVVIGYTYKLDLDKIQYVPPSRGLTFETMTIYHLDEIYHGYKDEMNERVYQDLLRKLKTPKFEGFIVKKDGEICDYCFINYKSSFPRMEFPYVDEKNNGYLLTDYVFNKFRNQKIQQYDIYSRLMVLKQKNFKTATGIVERYNYPSRSSIEKFGFKKCVIGFFFKCGNRRLSKDHFIVLKIK